MKQMNKCVQPHKNGQPQAESVERRPPDKGNSGQTTGNGTQRPSTTSLGLDRIGEAARKDPALQFTNLMHHVNTDLLHEAYWGLNPKAAAGVDSVTWEEYGKGLEGRLKAVHELVQSGAYRARPSKRIYIPKSDGRKRPIGIAALEDKIVQQALVWVLQSIYEADFKGFSYGFRPGRSPHHALDAIYVAITQRKVNYVLDADIRSFFDTLDHEWLMEFVGHRVGFQGHLNYYGVPGNRKAHTDAFRTELAKAWLRTLRRRSQKGRSLTWEKFCSYFSTWIPTACTVHPYPSERIRV